MSVILFSINFLHAELLKTLIRVDQEHRAHFDLANRKYLCQISLTQNKLMSIYQQFTEISDTY